MDRTRQSRRAAWSLFRRAVKNRDGMAATEFAMLVPIMVFLFFGMLETADAMTANRRVSLAVNTAADLAAQSEQLSPDEITALVDGVIAILEPIDTSVVQINMTSIVLDNNDDPIVHWSIDEAGDTPYVWGSDFTKLGDNFETSATGLIMLKNRSVIYVEIDFPYTPRFTDFFLSNTIQFSRTAMRSPRLVPRVQLCDNNGQNCTA